MKKAKRKNRTARPLHKPLLRWILLPVVVLAFVLAAELVLNHALLTLPREQKGSVVLFDTEAWNAQQQPNVTLASLASSDTGNEDEYGEDEGYEDYDEYDESWDDEYGEYGDTDEEDAESTSEASGIYTEMIVGENAALTITGDTYIGEMRLTAHYDGSDYYLVTCVAQDGTEFVAASAFSGESEDSIRINRQVSEVRISTRSGSLNITRVTAENGYHVNSARLAFEILLAACLYLLLAFSREIGEKPEYGFLTVMLTIGLFLAVWQPLNTGLAPDDGIHIGRVMHLSHGRESALHGAEIAMTDNGFNTVINEGFVHTPDTASDEYRFRDRLNAAHDITQTAESQTVQFQFSDVGYIIQALGVSIARWFGLPFSGQMVAGRLLNMLVYTAILFLTIRSIKRFRLTLAVVALAPTAVFLAANYTYDTMINALCFSGTALLVNAMTDRDTVLSPARCLCMLLAALLGGIVKVVYMPLILLALAIPASRFANKKQCLWFKVLTTVICFTAVLVMMSSVTSGQIALQDNRSPGADAAGQMAFLLAHPFTYFGYWFNFIVYNFYGYFISASRLSLGYVGYVSEPIATILLLMTAFTVFTDNDGDPALQLNAGKRIWMLLLAGLATGMLFTTMYIAFAEVGIADFPGVQGRYLLPILPLVLMLANPSGIHNRMNKRWWHTLFFTLNALMLFWVFGLFILEKYWM